MGKNLYVGNLSYSTTQQDLQEAFGKFGEVVSANLIVDQATGRSRGFGFVEMATEEDAGKAISAMNGTSFMNRTITVNEARPKTERARAGFGGRDERAGGGRRSWR